MPTYRLLSLGTAALCACGGDAPRTSDTAPTTTFPTSLGSDASTDATGTSSGPGSTSTPTTSGVGMTSSTSSEGSSTAVDPSSSTSDPSSSTGPACEGIECQVDDCGGDPKQTKLRGTVYAPEGTLPLYNITVYIPTAPLSPLPEGVQCDTCAGKNGLDGAPLVATITDTKGEFLLEGVPAGQDIPLVITVGKWRRQITVPVTACAENLAPGGLTRLPKDKSEGDIPRIALTTGGADPLECLLRKIGIADSEFTPETGDGRVNLYAAQGGSSSYTAMLNGGAAFTGAPVLWDSIDNLKKYDMVLMACEGGQNGGQKSNGARQNIADYAGLGGRLFFTHWHNIWIESGVDPWPTVADFNFQPDLPNPSTGRIDTSFPKGQALAEWMVNVGGSQVMGEMSIAEGQHTIDAVNPDLATRWIYTEAPLPQTVQYLTFNAPVGVPEDMQCGRVVDSDIHVSSGDQDGVDFPSGCTTKDLSPQEKALVFMFFELSACLIPDDQDPIPG